MKNKIFSAAAYLDILYFIEIINLMILLLVIYGNFISITAGIILTLLLSVHIIRIYFNMGNSRVIQLLLMDAHLAYSIPFFINIIINNYDNALFDYFFMIWRAIIVLMEIAFVRLLTDENLIKKALDSRPLSAANK